MRANWPSYRHIRVDGCNIGPLLKRIPVTTGIKELSHFIAGNNVKQALDYPKSVVFHRLERQTFVDTLNEFGVWFQVLMNLPFVIKSVRPDSAISNHNRVVHIHLDMIHAAKKRLGISFVKIT